MSAHTHALPRTLARLLTQAFTYSSTDMPAHLQERARDLGATALCHSQTSYLSLHDHCAELQSGTAGYADAQFRHPSGPPAPAAGPPQPARGQRTPPSSEGRPNRKEVLQVRVQGHWALGQVKIRSRGARGCSLPSPQGGPLTNKLILPDHFGAVCLWESTCSSPASSYQARFFPSPAPCGPSTTGAGGAGIACSGRAALGPEMGIPFLDILMYSMYVQCTHFSPPRPHPGNAGEARALLADKE